MEKEISKKLMCILIRGDVELWIEDSFIGQLKSALLVSKESKFLEIGDQVINTADIVGIFEAKTIAEKTRRKNGEWQDDKGNWHKRGERVCCKGNVVPFGMKCGYCSV